MSHRDHSLAPDIASSKVNREDDMIAIKTAGGLKKTSEAAASSGRSCLRCCPGRPAVAFRFYLGHWALVGISLIFSGISRFLLALAARGPKPIL